MPAPNVYQGYNAPELFVDLPEELKTSQADLLYVTDRKPETNEEGELIYGYGRSLSLAFGSAVVAIQPEMDWNALTRISLEDNRSEKLTLELVSIKELHRFPDTPWAMTRIDDVVQADPATLERAETAFGELRKELLRRLELAPKPEVIIFIHGFANDFTYAAQTLAEMWHFLGREHVPILYTWPAGHGGMTGYVYDRESGEFTIFHLKNLLRQLASIPEIEKMHLIAHSRGTDVLVTTIRELMLVSRAAGENPKETFRIENAILAAPDLDLEVVSQRVIAERMAGAVGTATIYTSQNDEAIGWATKIFGSVARLGRMSIKEIPEDRLETVDLVEGLSFVELEKKADASGHGYFHASPEASSDLIMTLRYGMKPGEQNGRPLSPIGGAFWLIKPDYPYSVNSE
jgi:esterase/lipase superfamily enzyme